MDTCLNSNGRMYTKKALESAAENIKDIKVYSNVVATEPLDANYLGNVVSGVVEDDSGHSRLDIICEIDTENTEDWEMVLDPFVMVPSGVGEVEPGGVVDRYRLTEVSLAPKEISSFKHASMKVIDESETAN